MLGKIGLGILAIIQMSTALTIFFSSKQEEMFGMKMLTKELSIYRYLLSSLWVSVSVIYILGALNNAYFREATILGIVNIVLEIISYWAGFVKNRNIIKYYPPIATIVMVIPLTMILLNLLGK